MKLDIDSIIFIGFLVATLVLGLSSSRGIKNIREYAIGNRNFSTATIAATIVATWISGDFFYNTISNTYGKGLYSIWIDIGSPISLLIYALFAAPRVGEFLGTLSIAEAMGSLFGQRVRIITAISGFVGTAGLIAVQLKLAGMVFEYALDIPGSYGIVSAAVIVIVYSSLGGIKSVTFTDIIQFITFAVVIPILAYTLLASIDSIDVVTDTLTKHELFDYKEVFAFSNQLSFSQFFLFLFFIFPGFSPAMFQRMAMAKNTLQVKRSFLVATMACFVLLVTLDWIGVLVLSINPSLGPNEVVKYVITNSFYTGLRGLALAGFIATIMSTVDSWINSASVLVVHDFLKPLKIEFTKNELLAARITSLIIGVIALFLSLREATLQELLVRIYSLYMPVVTVPFFMALLGFRSTEKSVILGMIAGIGTALTWNYILEIKAANAIPFAMFANLVVLMGSHYLLKQPGGWVGIKDDSEIVRIRTERRKKWQDFLGRVRSFNIIEICRNNSPKGDGLISMLGFFVMVSVFGSTHSLAKEYQDKFSDIINVLYPITLCSTSILIAYPLWIEPWRRTNLIYFFWCLIAFFVLVCFSFLMVLISGFSEIQLMVFMVNIMVVSSFAKWHWSLFNVILGVGLVTIFYDYWFNDLGLVIQGSSQFKIIYLLMLISGSVVLFLKPKEEKHELTEKKNTHLTKRIGIQEQESQKAWNLRSEFIRNISHEYHAPMTGISSMADALLGAYDKINDKKRKEAIEEILKNSVRLEAFDANISSLSKLSNPNYQLKLEKMDFSDLVYERLMFCRRLYEENKEDREFRVNARETVMIIGDRYYLSQMLDNLIINAITYCPKGKIDILLTQTESAVEFIISDEGIAIPTRELYDIFAEFTVSSRTHTPAGGRGVGLTLAQRVALVHGGNIKAESDGVKGAQFTVTLPKN